MSNPNSHASRSFRSLGDLLTADLDEQKFQLVHPRSVPFIQSPLNSKDDSIIINHSESEGDRPPTNATNNTQYLKATQEPILRYHHESSTIQLFYDLFFVANLTNFTSKHAVINASTLKSYVGFFSLLWFTWFQVALFDVRFGNDSIVERLFKLVQLGIMVGLAVEAPLFYLGDKFDGTPFKIISLILMASRLVLGLQYAVSWVWLREYRKAHAPMIGHVVVMLMSGMIFLGLAFGFTGPAGENCLIGWYVLMGAEVVALLLMSGRHAFLNFKGTNVIERLGLLTLIILGEGIIGLGESIQTIQKADQFVSSDIIGLIIAAVLIIFCLYILYFDQIETEKERIGALRQQIWALCHYPFHVCILLVTAGFTELTIWRKIVDYLNLTLGILGAIPYPEDDSMDAWEAYANAINSTLSNYFGDLTTFGDSFEESLNAMAESRGNETEFTNAYYEIVGTVTEVVAKAFEVEIEEDPFTGETSGSEVLDQISSNYSTIFLYFFITAGLTLIFLSVLFILGKRKHSRLEKLSIFVRIIVGIGLSLVSIMYATMNTSDAFGNYFFSPWMPPTVLLAYVLVVVIDMAIVGIGRRAVRRRSNPSHA